MITKSITTNLSFLLNYNKIVFDLLPKRYRTITVFKFLLSSISSLTRFWNNNFLVYRENSLKEIRINCQTIVLEHYLNYFFNQTDIQIINTSYTIQLTYLYNKNEVGNAVAPVYIYNRDETPSTSQVYLYTKSEVVVDVDFTVKVPLSLLSTGVTQQQIRAIVDKYIPLGVVYKIEII